MLHGIKSIEGRNICEVKGGEMGHELLTQKKLIDAYEYIILWVEGSDMNLHRILLFREKFKGKDQNKELYAPP